MNPTLKELILVATQKPESAAAFVEANRGALALRTDRVGETALHYVVIEGCIAAARALLDAGADVNSTTHHRETALGFAVRAGNVELARLLLARGADANIGAEPPLSYAIQMGRPVFVDLLLNSGADPNQADDIGQTPLLFAIRGNAVELFKVLLQHGADPLKIDGLEGKALHAAALYANEDVCRMLLDAGCPLDARDEKGATASETAEAWGRANIVRFLASQQNRPK